MTATVFSLPRTGYHIERMALSYRIITPLYEPAMPAKTTEPRTPPVGLQNHTHLL